MTSPTCKIVMYHKDTRMPETSSHSTMELSVSREAATRVNEVVCSFFEVTAPWDRQVVGSVFFSDIDSNWYEFTQRAAPVICGVKIDPRSDRNVVFTPKTDTFEVLDKGPRKLHVTAGGIFGSMEYDIMADELRTKYKQSHTAVALYNSESIVKCTQCSTNLGMARTFEVIDSSGAGAGRGEA